MVAEETSVTRINGSMSERLITLRRDLHRRPELSNHELATAARIATELGALGLTEIRQIAGTGLAVDVCGDSRGPLVVVRADMDALPITEDTRLPFASETPGVMHACGHDAHSAMAVGAASLALDRPPAGTLRFVFQPAEEAEPLGGRRVVAEGALDGAIAAIALHVHPSLPTGTVGLRAGPSMASSDEFTITVTGRAGHVGWPHEAVDAIAAATAIVVELQTIVSRRTDPRTPITVHVGRIEGGSAGNVVADTVVMTGTIRALSAGARARAHELVGEVASAVAAAHGARAEAEVVSGEPPLDNHPSVIDAFAAAAATGSVRRLPQPTMNSEDFAFYTERVPAGMAWLGVGGEDAAPLHHPRFTIDEAALPIGAALLYDTACALLAAPPELDRR
ncbi:MAG TPA: M20 family metallopeptidase [Solirubrobacteraceae bacterium]|nr:M20 family metallopeptidase [Solirubrobacteraceae bacterium]